MTRMRGETMSGRLPSEQWPAPLLVCVLLLLLPLPPQEQAAAVPVKEGTGRQASLPLLHKKGQETEAKRVLSKNCFQ